MPLVNPITEPQIPPPIARDTEFQAADVAHLKELDPHIQYFLKNLLHNSSGSNPDIYPTGYVSQDLYINGVLSGWHVLTLLRGGNNSFGVQLAIADTQNYIFYRRKVSDVWQSWLRVSLTVS
jgi:hypothetical protein